MAITRITQLSEEERGRFNEWADKWIEVGLRTGPADREKFEAAVRDCYRFAGIEWPGVVVWVPSPLVMAFAAPTAAFAIELTEALQRRQLLESDVGGAVGGAVRGAVDGAVGGAVDGGVAVGGAVDGAVAVGGAVDGAVEDEIRRGVLAAISRSYYYRLGGQFWAGGWSWYGAAYTSFFRDVCGLELKGDLWDRGRAYEATVESACWWWPHRRFVMVCERPLEIHREEVGPRGWGSHRLHRADGPAVVWPDGWGVYSVHGVRVSAQVVEAPDTLTVEQIRGEENAEVRRVMLDRFGWDRYLRESDAELLDEVHEPPFPGLIDARLCRIEIPEDEPLVMVLCKNSTAEPDGSHREYALRVPPGVRTCHEALAWTFDMTDAEYVPAVES